MSLLSSILSYSKNTQDIRAKYKDDVDKLENEKASKLAEKDSQIAALERENHNLGSSLLIAKAHLQEGIYLEYEEKMYSSYEDYLGEFDEKSSFVIQKFKDQGNFEESKKVVYELLKRRKTIEEVELPSLNQQKENITAQFNVDKSNRKEAFENEISDIRLPLKKDYETAIQHNASEYNFQSLPMNQDDLPSYFTIGNYILESNEELHEITDAEPIKIPVDIDSRNSGNIILKIDSNHLYDHDSRIEKIITGITMRYIESFPSGHVKLGLYSSSITSFGRLSALFTSLMKKKFTVMPETCKTRDQFSRLLLTISQRGEIVNSKLLENNCYDLYELFEKDIKTEDFQVIIVHDAFKEMTVDNINQFHGCISELKKCGIRFIIIDDFNEEYYKNKPAAFMSKLNQILECCDVFNLEGKKAFDKDHNEVEFISTAGMTSQEIYAFANKYCEYADQQKAPYIPYEKVGFGQLDADPENLQSIAIPVAFNAPDVWNMEFDVKGEAPNANIVVGVPGTGKSTLIDSLVMNGAMKYSPDEVVFQLLDFKDGISSSVYTMPECHIPHIKVVSQNNKPEEADIILTNILIEGERRNMMFKEFGNEISRPITDIVTYNKYARDPQYGRQNMPRLIIVIDECQYLFDDDVLAKKCEDMIKKCRSQGIHLILATQTLNHKMWNTIKFIQGKYVFYVAKDDAEQLLDRKYVGLIPTEIPKGSFMAFASNDSGLNCSKIKIAFDGGNTPKYAEQIRAKWSEYPIDIVVIGDKSPKRISLTDYDKYFAECGGELPIGENYNNHQLMTISYEKRKPLVMIGSNENASNSMFKSLIYGASKQNLKVYLVDASQSQSVKRFAEKCNPGNFTIGDENDYLPILSEVLDIYKEREKNLRGDNYPIMFIVNGAQNILTLLNNAKFNDEPEEGVRIVQEDARKMTLDDFLVKQKAAKDNKPKNAVSGKDTLVPYLLGNCYKANIFICFAADSVNFNNDAGEKVFGHHEHNTMRSADYKILYVNYNSDVRNIMDDTFKEKMLNGLSEDMAFMSYEQRDYFKFRYFQLEDNE